MHYVKVMMMAMGVVLLAGCGTEYEPICCDGGYEYRHRNQWDADKVSADMNNRLAALERERQRLADELTAAQKQNSTLNGRVSDLERQLVDRDRDLAALRGNAGDSAVLASKLSSATGDLDQLKQRNADLERQLAALQGGAGDKDKLAADLAAAKQRIAELEKQLARLRRNLSAGIQKLSAAQRGLLRTLRPEIDTGNVTVDLNNEHLLINLASSMLFGTGEDQLKPVGVDALKQVGSILKDYPEYNTEVAGHTDTLKTRSALKKKFATNRQLSEARVVKALTDGGMSASALKATGYADTKPVAPNATDAGRQKNRRVEVRVTPKQ